jgi:hypothetical protein
MASQNHPLLQPPSPPGSPESGYTSLMPGGGGYPGPTRRRRRDDGRRWWTRVGIRHQKTRAAARHWLDSRKKHYTVMALVAVDVLAVLGELTAALLACETERQGRGRERAFEAMKEGCELVGMATASLFVGELGACLWAFGFG